jgi:tRNA nucleotidyltransferase (CCA-adding enzyme)
MASPVLDRVRDLPGVWVVGGTVRDALLGREPRDLDLLVEADPAPVLERLGPPGVAHERFGTFEYPHVNVAVARRETYPRPGALPEVELGVSVAEDLARRDFTVNAMAERLSDGHREVFPGALEDLEARRLRVLHERSFVDDPTRVLRLARYAARLGFGIEEETERLALAADFGTASGSRLGAEVRLALGEPLPEALVALERYARAAIHPAFSVDPELIRGLPPLAALGACLLDADDVPGALDALAFTAEERRVVAAAARGRELADALQSAATPAEVAAVARREPDEALDVAAVLGAEEPVRRWREEWSHVQPAIDGNDLIAAGLSGPAIGAALSAAWAAAVEGADRDAQLAAALEAAR